MDLQQKRALMPGPIASYRGLSTELLHTRREAQWVEGENHTAPFPVPPFGKRGVWGDFEAVENPPNSPFKKGDFKASTLKGES